MGYLLADVVGYLRRDQQRQPDEDEDDRDNG